MYNVSEDVHLLFMDFEYLCPGIKNKYTFYTKIF